MFFNSESKCTPLWMTKSLQLLSRSFSPTLSKLSLINKKKLRSGPNKDEKSNFKVTEQSKGHVTHSF